MSKLSHITIFPIKSLDRLSLQSCQLLPSGALKGDREFAIYDSDDRLVNAKRTAKIQAIRSHYDIENRSIILSAPNLNPTEFHLDDDRKSIEQWLSEYFGLIVHLKQNLEMGFPDDPASPGPTVISTQTLQTVATWYDGMTLEESRSRFRTNLELDVPIAFWEDQLFGKAADEIREFRIGHIVFQAVNPCQRCVVPTRNSISGDVTNSFQKTFLNMRLQTLPDGVERSRFNHYYRLAINTRLKPNQPNPTLKLGDVVDR
jgi:uncharacterized protein